MVFTEATGVIVIAIGAYVLARPMQIRSFSTPAKWEEDPDGARQEQRAYAAMLGVAAILGGLGLIALGLFGSGP